MATCVKCGKSGLLFKVNALGLCPNCVDTELLQLRQQVNEYNKPEYSNMVMLKNTMSTLTEQINSLQYQIQSKQQEIANLDYTLHEHQKDLIVLDDDILMQDFSLYKPMYEFANSDGYKERLALIRKKQKDLMKNNDAVTFSQNWTVDGSVAKGRKMTNDNIKQILRSFNCECENVIDRVKYNNIDSMRQRIIKAYETLNKLNETNKIFIKNEFLMLKFEELNLAIEFQMKKQEEKEEQKRIRAELREQAKFEAEAAEARKNIEKEKSHYSNALERLQTQIKNETDETKLAALNAKQEEMQTKIAELTNEIAAVDYRIANQKAGYVYIISNIGAFGENVFKIGMTRRLEPLDRINELGDASVPFNFDVHALIFSDNAPALENSLHKAFENRKVNMVNTRREFFNATLEEIQEVVKQSFDKTVEFTMLPDAEQYRTTLQMKKALELETQG